VLVSIVVAVLIAVVVAVVVAILVAVVSLSLLPKSYERNRLRPAAHGLLAPVAAGPRRFPGGQLLPSSGGNRLRKQLQGMSTFHVNLARKSLWVWVSGFGSLGLGLWV
jgi:NADH:ubiquinone oxidoreductase subunit 3 (subunit A)